MNIWDWKYRIFFDKDVEKKVRSWIASLKKEEKKIYTDIIDFYNSFYSFGILYDLIEENNDNAAQLILIAEENIDKIIILPQVLVPYYKRMIKTSIHDSILKQRLLNILKTAITAKDNTQDYWNFIKNLFGESFLSLKEAFTSEDFDHTYWRIPAQKVIKSNVEITFDNVYNNTVKDKSICEKFGQSAIKTFNKTIVEGNGYGEWWDREISDSGHDELILYTNNNCVKSDDYLYTILHESYPGHGHFYNAIRQKNKNIDHGAMHLIEGWATYCEWHTYPSKYVDTIRHNDLVTLNRSYYLSQNEKAKQIYIRKRSQHKKVSQFSSSIIYSTQYIGYLESYYLGALWLEKAIDNIYKTPVTFLKMLSECNKGEFFKLWQ